MDHYRNLSFIKHHKVTPKDWVYLFDDHFELKVNDKYNQTKKSYLEVWCADEDGGEAGGLMGGEDGGGESRKVGNLMWGWGWKVLS